MLKSYNDGVIAIYSTKNNLNSFSAKVNEKSIENLEFVTNLFFKEESKRQQDILFAHSCDKSLTFKIKTPYTNTVKTSHKVIYDGMLYDIFFIDPSKDKKELYLYLEEVRKIGV